jgi:hypothetical protein
MRKTPPPKLEAGRVREGPMASSPDYGMTGAFFVMGPKGAKLKIVSSGVDDEYGWEHVSVSVQHRTPNWDEMCFVKDLFWREDECVMQLHPAKSEYINCHPNCLHLWMPMSGKIPTPPSMLV